MSTHNLNIIKYMAHWSLYLLHYLNFSSSYVLFLLKTMTIYVYIANFLQPESEHLDQLS